VILAEEVEIGNVGGSDGVASEVTLARLVVTMEAMAKAKGVNPADITKKMQAVMDESSKHIKENSTAKKENTKETKKTTNTIKKLGQASMNAVGGLLGSVVGGFTGLAKEFVNGGNNLSDFAQHIPIVGGLLGGFAGYIDNTVSTFRTLSATGAAFGNDMMETRRSAAQMGLSLDEFAGLITNNADNLAALGGSVTLGAERFKKMNDNIKKSGDFAALKNMGFTVEEVNEGMGDYIDLQARMGTLQGKSTEELAAGSADYLKQVDLLAKVTGKTREEAEKALREQATDAGIRGMLNAFRDAEGNLTEGGKNLQLSLGLIDDVGGAAGAAMKDLLDGMPSGPETGQFLAMMGDAGPAVQDALKQIGQGADPKILQEALENSVEGLSGFAKGTAAEQKQMIDVLRQANPAMGEFLDTIPQLMKVAGRDLGAAKKEQDARDKTTDAFTTFEEAIRAARGIIQEAFVDSGIFEGAAALVKDFSTKITGIIEDGTLQATMDSFFNSISTFVDNFKKYGLGTALFGGEEEIDTPDGKKTVQVKGLIGDLFGEGGTISKAFGDSGNIVLEGITAAAKGFADGMFDFDIPWGTLFIGGLVGIGAAIAAPVLAIPAGIAAAVVAVFGIQAMKDLLAGAWDMLTGAFTWGADVLGDAATGISGLFSTAWESVTGWFTVGEDGNYSIIDIATKAWDSVTGWFTLVDTKFSISEDLTKLWNTVTGWFGFGEGEATYAISTLISEAWTKITGFFDFGEEGFSISALATKAWETVKGFFTWQADTIGLGISILATKAWETVKGFFAWGEEATGFSISGLLTTAWETVTGMFSFGELAIPSISSMFQGIIDKVKGFFTFDFEMPNFKQYLPKWLGGEGKSFFGDETAAVETPEAPEAPDPASLDPTQAQTGLAALQQTQSVVQSFASIPELQNNLETLKKGLDINGVRTYTSAMESLVEVLGKLNDELAKDNKYGPGKGTNAGDVVAKMDSIGGGSSNSDQLNSTMGAVLAVLSEIRDIELGVQRNTKNLASGNIATSSVSVLPG
jgi:hypothetical protein